MPLSCPALLLPLSSCLPSLPVRLSAYFQAAHVCLTMSREPCTRCMPKSTNTSTCSMPSTCKSMPKHAVRAHACLKNGMPQWPCQLPFFLLLLPVPMQAFFHFSSTTRRARAQKSEIRSSVSCRARLAMLLPCCHVQSLLSKVKSFSVTANGRPAHIQLKVRLLGKVERRVSLSVPSQEKEHVPSQWMLLRWSLERRWTERGLWGPEGIKENTHMSQQGRQEVPEQDEICGRQ